MGSYFLVYGRASSDPDDQRISVDRQLKLCVARGHQLWPDAEARVFRDDDITAAKPGVVRAGFDGFLTAVRAAQAGDLAGVVVDAQSRLTRQGTMAWDDLVVTFTRAGLTEVHTLKTGAVSVEPGNRLVGRIMSVIDQEEVERTKARTRGLHRDLFAEGRPVGRAPFGFRAVRKTADGAKARVQWVHDEDQAPVVRDIFAWAQEGVAVGVIADKLNAAGVPPASATWTFKKKPRKTPPRWQKATVRSVLASPAVAGLRGHTDEDGNLHTVPATRWEAIVPEETWRKVQRMLGLPTTVTGANGQTYRVRTQPRPTPRRYLLSGGTRAGELYGMLRCGKCGTPLVAQTQARRDGVRVPGYQCHPKLTSAACGGVSITPAQEVEDRVVDLMQAELRRSPKLRRRLTAASDKAVAAVRSERDDAKARMMEAGQLRGRGDIDADVFGEMHRAAKADYDAAAAQLAAMTSEDADLPTVDDVLDRWDDLTLKRQRAVLDRLIESVVIAPGHLGRPGFNAARIGTPTWAR